MKKTLVGFFVAALLFPSSAFAQYHADPQINSLISELYKQVELLQKQLTQLVAAQEKTERAVKEQQEKDKVREEQERIKAAEDDAARNNVVRCVYTADKRRTCGG